MPYFIQLPLFVCLRRGILDRPRVLIPPSENWHYRQVSSCQLHEIIKEVAAISKEVTCIWEVRGAPDLARVIIRNADAQCTNEKMSIS